MTYQNQIIEGEAIVFLNVSLYSKESIFKCMYWYGDKFRTNISFEDSETYRVAVKPISSTEYSNLELEELLVKLERDLIDYNLRDIVTKETQNIRDLLIAKAFSSGEFDELPPGEVSDPVGFNLNQLKND